MIHPKPAKALCDDLEIWGLEDDTLLFDDGSFGFGLRLKPLDISCYSVTATNDLKASFCTFLNGLPAELDLQLIAETGFGSEKWITEHESLMEETAPRSIQELTRARTKALRQEDKNKLMPVRKLYLFVRARARNSLIKSSFLPSLIASKKRYEAIADGRLERELTNLERLRTLLTSELSQMGLDPISLQAKEVLDLIYDQWNPHQQFPLSSFDGDELKQRLTYTDVGISDRGFCVGNAKHRVISLKHLPDPTIAGMAQAFNGLPLGSRLVITIHVPDQTKELETLQTSRRVAFAMARGKRSGVSDLESEAKLQDIETLLEQMIAQGERAFHVSINVVLRGTNDEDLDQDVQSCLSTFRSLSGAEAMEETLASYFVFKEFALPNARAKERVKKIKTSNLADLLPFFGQWEGMDVPRVLLRTNEGGLFKLDPFSGDLTNANQLISGGSGAGKSFFTNVLILQMLKESPQVFFVDIGGSYKKICENLGGTYLPLGLGSGISINPFDLATGETTPSPEKVKLLLALIELMTKEDDVARLSRLERAGVESAIQTLYREHAAPRLSDLKALLLKDEMPEIQKIGKILTSWSGESPYGAFVDRPTSISWQGKCVAFDLKGLERYPDLQAVCLFMITDLVWRTIQQDREMMKFVVFDECWQLLKSESGITFIEEVFRTFRKYRASAIAISQALGDFSKSKIADAILKCCSLKWLLSQGGVDEDLLSQVLNLNPTEIELVKKVHSVKGSYSQAFLLAQDKRGIVVTESLPTEYWLSTTDPPDLAMLEKFKIENPHQSQWEVLTALAQSYPRGVSAYEKERR